MTMVDGNQIASEIYEEIRNKVTATQRTFKMTVLTCSPNFETVKYLELKKKKAAEVGIALNVVELGSDEPTKSFVDCIFALEKTSDGIVVQLPLPAAVDREVVLAAIPKSKDPDGFSYDVETSLCLPPVVGAIDEISNRYRVEWKNKSVAIIGQGRLVGQPAELYANQKGAIVEVLTEDSVNFKEIITAADIIISGAGHPNLVTKEMVKEGVVIFDAGASEDGGVLRGDVHPDVAAITSLFTPVPGGIGPITVAVLLQNLLLLASSIDVT